VIRKYFVGNIYRNSIDLEYKIIEKIDSTTFVVKFTNSGYETKSSITTISNGLIRDYLNPSIFGVGMLGYASKINNKIAYSKWYSMLDRCYNPAYVGYKFYGGNGITVCDRWFRFDYFLEDIPKIDGYNEELFLHKKLHLDKDIKQFDMEFKIYSLDTCMFVSQKENELYRKYSIQQDFIAITPLGEIFYGKSVNQFARDYNLDISNISACLNGRHRHHRGWRFVYTKDVLNYVKEIRRTAN
jgi:hypothetical protein